MRSQIPEIQSWIDAMPGHATLNLSGKELEYLACLQRRAKHLSKRIPPPGSKQFRFDALEKEALEWAVSRVLDNA